MPGVRRGTPETSPPVSLSDSDVAEPDIPIARNDVGRHGPHLLAAILFVAYATVSVCRFRRLETMSWDLGIFEQVVRAYARLDAPIADLKGPGANILGDHFSPILVLLAPAYRIFATPVTLLIAQSALFAVSAIPVTRAATRVLGRGRGLAIGVAYGLSWGLQRAVDFDFHEICFAVPLIAFSLEALLAERRRAALFWAAPLVLVKEDLGLTAAAIAVLVGWRARGSGKRDLPYAVGVAALGVATTVVALVWIIPAFNSGGSYAYWDKLGDDTGPVAALTTALDTKTRTFLWIMLPTTGLLALRSPLFLVAVPTLGWRFVSADDHYWGTDWHYNAVLMPIVLLALVDTLGRLRRSRRSRVRVFASHLPATLCGAALALTTMMPLSALTTGDTYRQSSRATAAERLLDRIPDGATVEADVPSLSRLTSRCRVFWLGSAPGVNPQYIAFDNASDWVDNPIAYAKQLHPEVDYTTVSAATGGFVLLRQQSS
ncbi:DUF2079 domain-containing protein [Embleya sp. NPDC001921]